jgi:hypothetical protein
MTEGIGCSCGWPLDSCNPKYLKGNGSCDEARFDRQNSAPQHPKWVAVPMPDGTTDEVFALVTEDLTAEEVEALGEYVEWLRSRTASSTGRQASWVQRSQEKS